MNRINQLFAQKRENILSIYFCAGHPTLDSTADTIRTLAANGIDMIEVGIPFSDPMADGPVIQNAATQALRNGMTLKKLFQQLETLNRNTSSPLGGIRGGLLPLILMGYLNPIMQFGFEAFCQRCNDVGVDGMIIPDLPFADYLSEVKPVADRYDLRVIMMITPETSEERIRFIDDNTDGFIYMVSSAAITGAQKSFDEAKQDYFRRINAMNLRNPRMIGFGISNKQTLQSAQQNAAGAIIGSKFVTLLNESNGDVNTAIDKLYEALSH
jgi:tryptophan synthase alpha chain